MFISPLETFPRQQDHPPLLAVEEIYASLYPLQEGDQIPLHVYVSNYDTGTIPSWTVIQRLGGCRFLLVIIDPNAEPVAPKCYPVACNIIGTPSTVLATPHYQLKEGYGPPGMAYSLPQQAWAVVRGKLRPRRGRSALLSAHGMEE